MTKRPANIEDKDFLCSLNKAVYRSLVEKINGLWDDEFQREYFNQKWEKSGYQIIEKDKVKIGTIWVEYEPDQHTLKEIQILPEFQNHGIGTDLLKSEIMLARKANVPLRLRLLNSNPAQSLYKRLGFKTYKEDGNYLYMELNV
jgi:ribosomal protein S18 acetylase RimI-like enzyme